MMVLDSLFKGILRIFSGRREDAVVEQIIGRGTYVLPESLWQPLVLPTYDTLRPDYAWWDKFRNGLQPGFEIIGAQAASFVETLADYVIGRGLTIKLDTVRDARLQRKAAYTNEVLRRLSLSSQRFFYDLFVDLLCLGDAFVYVSPKGSFISIPPNTVSVEYDPRNPREVLAYKISSAFGGLTVEEYLTANIRRSHVKGTLPDGTAIDETVEAPNLLGKIPIVHFAFDRKSDELFGRPVFAGCLPAFSAWNNLLEKATRGAYVAGNPVPVFENLDNPTETIDLNAADDLEYEAESGEQRVQKRIEWDRIGAFFLGKGGRFRFASPPVGFSGDLQRVSMEMRQLILGRLHIPGHLVGGDLRVSTTGVREQMPSWVRHVEALRDRFAGNVIDDGLGGDVRGGGLHELIDLFLRTRRLFDSDILVYPVVIRWSDVTEGDERIEFEKVKWAHSRRAISTETALGLLNLVEDTASEVDKARQEPRPFAEAVFDDFEGGKLTEDLTPDERTNGGRAPRPGGSSTPRMPAYGGGGRVR